MRYRLTATLMVFTAFGAVLASGQQASKCETDRDGRELKGPVRSVKIMTEVLEAADKDNVSDGWIPSEITFDKYGNIETDVQFGRAGEIFDKTSAEIDKAGNKIKETHFDAAGELKFTHVFEYDRSGNIVEFKRIEADGKVSGISRFEIDKYGRSDSNTSYNTDGTVNTTTEVSYDKTGERVGETSSTPEGGIVSRVEYKRTKRDGAETVETLLFNGDGKLNSRYVESTDKNGDVTMQGFDGDGVHVEKQTWEYSKKDFHGNWTIEIMTKWETKDGELVLKLRKKTVRTIAYF